MRKMVRRVGEGGIKKCRPLDTVFDGSRLGRDVDPHLAVCATICRFFTDFIGQKLPDAKSLAGD
jgi:hypothetical protein